jgi:hypothetical protein
MTRQRFSGECAMNKYSMDWLKHRETELPKEIAWMKANGQDAGTVAFYENEALHNPEVLKLAAQHPALELEEIEEMIRARNPRRHLRKPVGLPTAIARSPHQTATNAVARDRSA